MFLDQFGSAKQGFKPQKTQTWSSLQNTTKIPRAKRKRKKERKKQGPGFVFDYFEGNPLILLDSCSALVADSRRP